MISAVGSQYYLPGTPTPIDNLRAFNTAMEQNIAKLLGYKNYTLEYAHPQWFIATNDRYWKLKMRKFLGRDKWYLEIQQKKDRYTVKGFVKLF